MEFLKISESSLTSVSEFKGICKDTKLKLPTAQKAPSSEVG